MSTLMYKERYEEDAPDLPPLIQATHDEEANIWWLSHRSGGTLMFRVDRRVLIVESCNTAESATPGSVRDAFLTYLEEEAGIQGCRMIEFYDSVIPVDDVPKPGDYFTARGYVETASGKWIRPVGELSQSSQINVAQSA